MRLALCRHPTFNTSDVARIRNNYCSRCYSKMKSLLRTTTADDTQTHRLLSLAHSKGKEWFTDGLDVKRGCLHRLLQALLGHVECWGVQATRGMQAFGCQIARGIEWQVACSIEKKHKFDDYVAPCTCDRVCRCMGLRVETHTHIHRWIYA